MDWILIKELLQVVEMTAGHPNLKNLRDQALVELQNWNDGKYAQEEEPADE